MDARNPDEQKSDPSPSDQPAMPGAGEAEPVCATCGSSLLQWGNAGECLRCLVNFVAVPDDGQRGNEPAATENPDSVAAQYGHFQISKSGDGLPIVLGRGAMGATYRAHDTVLDCPVALKLIDRVVANHPVAKARFLREARAAAQFHHPNVARVSYYGEQDGACYYAMELVDGETLEARVRREGPLSALQMLEIAMQAARALAAAEAHGIIHRDLKPTNLMLTTQTGDAAARGGAVLVKLIDFGLAKAVGAAARSSSANDTQHSFVGTPAFASPEQFERADQEIDHRSDIYSLGVTMWFALCGKVPFVGRYLDEIRVRQNERLPLEKLEAQRVPGSVVQLLQAMLSVDPAARPQSAVELLGHLERCRESVAESSPRPFRSRSVAGAIALAGITILAVTLGLWWAFRDRTIPPGDRSIAVLPFENLSPNGADAFFCVGMQDQVTADLARVAALKVIGRESVQGYRPGRRDLGQTGRELGVRYVLTGSVRREGETVRVQIGLVDTHDVGHPWSAEYERRLADVFVVQSEIARAVADRLQSPLSLAEKTAINRPPTTDLVAYDLFLRARESPATLPDASAVLAETERQVALLKEAVARDPRFMLAWCDLATAYDNLYFNLSAGTPEQKSVDYRALAETALGQARRLQPEAAELHLAQANHFLYVAHDVEQARLETEAARRAQPHSADMLNLLGRIARRQGRWEEAIEALEQSVTLEPRNTAYLSDLIESYHALRRFGDSDRTFARLIALLPPGEQAAPICGHALGAVEARADVAPLRAALARFPADRQADPATLDTFRFALALYARNADAIFRLSAGRVPATVMVQGINYPTAWFEGVAARLRGDDAAAKRAFAVARPEMEKIVLSDATDGRLLGVLAVIDAGLGRKDQALEEGRHALEMVKPFERFAFEAPGVGCNLATVYAWTGESDLALAELQGWAGRPAGGGLVWQVTYGDLRLNPVWDPLRSDPRFDALVSSLAETR